MTVDELVLVHGKAAVLALGSAGPEGPKSKRSDMSARVDWRRLVWSHLKNRNRLEKTKDLKTKLKVDVRESCGHSMILSRLDPPSESTIKSTMLKHGKTWFPWVQNDVLLTVVDEEYDRYGGADAVANFSRWIMRSRDALAVNVFDRLNEMCHDTGLPSY